MKKVLSLVLVIAMFCGIFAGLQITANALSSSGKCGDNVTYTFDSSTGEVIISGSGKMYNYSSDAGISYSPFYNSSEIKRVIIEKGVTNIGMDMFFNCKSLTSLDIASTVKSFEQGCFWNCSSLQYLDIPSTTTNIGPYMFNKCSKLKGLDLPSSLTVIGDWFFLDCKSLEYVVIPKSVKTIKEYAFDNCTALQKVYYTGTKEEWQKIKIKAYNDILSKVLIVYDSNGESTEKIHKSFTSGEKTFKGDMGYYYSDFYFNKAATIYNQSLATMSLCLAFSTYQSDDGIVTYQNAENVLSNCGFESIMPYGYNKTTQKDGIGTIIGMKQVEGKKLISVAVRSGGYGAEWSSNTKVDAYGDHFGFDQSADKVQGYIYSYIMKNKIEGDIKIWITGFSRGGAVATHTAAKLNNSGGVTYTIDNAYKTASFSKNNIYAYGFATPAGAIGESKPHSSKYNNIFSVIDYNDPVPLVAPSMWGFDRYGTTKVLPFRESNNSNDFSKYYQCVIERMGSNQYKVDDFKNYALVGNDSFANAVYQKFNKDTLGTFNKKLVNALAGSIGTRQKYYSNYQNDLMKFLEKKMGNSDLDIGLILQEACNLTPKMAVFHPNFTITLINNLSLIADVHANQSYYLTWMQLMDPNYANSLPLMWGKSNYRIATANCPVDMKVYDSTGKLVAAIINEVPQVIEDSTIVASIDENDQKIVYLPVDEEYDIEIISRENSVVTCGIDEIDSEYGETIRTVNCSDLRVRKDEVLSANIPAFSNDEIEDGTPNGSDAYYSFKHEENTIIPNLDVKGSDEITNHTYEVTVEYDSNCGNVYGMGNFTEGSFVKLIADSNPGFEFAGFYINGKKIIDDDLDDNKNTVRFEVKGNTEISAVFYATQACKEHSYSDKITKPTATTLGYTTHTCSLCGDTYRDTYKSPTGKLTLKYSARTANALKVTWNNVGTATGYQVQISTKDGKKWSTYATLKAGVTNYIFKKLAAGNNYKFRVRFYIKGADGKNYYSPWSATLNSPTLPTGTTITKLTPAKNAFTVQWKKNAAVNGYQIQYATNSKFSNAKTVTIKKAATIKQTLQKLQGKTRYYVRLRTYKTAGGKNYFSTWSAAKSTVTKGKISLPTPKATGIKVSWNEQTQKAWRTVKWNKTNGVFTGFQVQYGMSAGNHYGKWTPTKWFTTKKIKGTDKTSLVQNLTYGSGDDVDIARVRTYYTIGSKTYYGAWSKIVKQKW